MDSNELNLVILNKLKEVIELPENITSLNLELRIGNPPLIDCEYIPKLIKIKDDRNEH